MNQLNRLAELRRQKQAFGAESADFVEWCLLRNERIEQSECRHLLETMGLEMAEPVLPGAGPKRGPLEMGEQVRVDKIKNTNALNTDVCEKWHDHVGSIHEVKTDHVVVQFESTERVQFMGTESGSKTGLYRWTPVAVADKPGRGILEVVYVSDKTAPPPSKQQIKMVEEYVAKGLEQGESRVDVYYTGLPLKMAQGKDGFYFSFFPTQRATPITGAHPRSVNPAKGHVYYIGQLGKRPGGWEADLAKIRKTLTTIDEAGKYHNEEHWVSHQASKRSSGTDPKEYSPDYYLTKSFAAALHQAQLTRQPMYVVAYAVNSADYTTYAPRTPHWIVYPDGRKEFVRAKMAFDSESALRNAVVKLAHEVPTMRKHLVPILKDNRETR